MYKTRNFLAIVTTCFLLFSGQSQGYTFLVTNSTQLQDALTNAQTNGEDDEIRLVYGTYTASGPFTYGTASNDNHSVTLSGGWHPSIPGYQINEPEITKLDGGGLNPVLQIDANAPGVNITFIIENLTVQNGYARSTDYSGGGILTFTGQAGSGSINLTIQNCIFQNNNAPNNKSGGAIYSTGSIEVYDTKFMSNTAYNGGAIVLAYDIDESQSSSPVLENCYFEDNSNYGNQGSTIWTNCAPRISGCTFKGRSDGVSSSGNGSCIWGNNGSHLNIVNSVFSDITIKYWAPAIQVWYSSLDITNCLFANNTAGYGGNGYGAIALLCNSSDTINITNCTFTGNTDSGSYSGAINNRGATVNLNNCIFWDNGGDTGVYNESGTTTMRYCLHGSGAMYGVTHDGTNFYDNPMFIDDDVFRLSAGSPCIDAGNNDLVPPATTLDVAGKTRFRDDPYTDDTGIGTAPIVDIGAYEYQLISRFGTVDGKHVKLPLTDGVGNVVTFGLTGPGFGAIDGDDPSFSNIELYGTDEKSQLSISTKAKDGTSVGDIMCFGPLKGIAAKATDLNGSITIGSPAIVNPKAAVTIAFDQGEDLTINSEMPIKSISAMEWSGSLTAPSVGSITTKSNYKLDKWGYLYIDVKTGDIGSVKVADEISGTWDCKSVKSITAFDTDDFYLTLSQKPDAKILALGKLTIKEDFSWSRIISSGNIGTVTVGEMRYANCFAGVDSAYLVDLNTDDVLDLPPVLGDTFNESATIKSIAIKGVKGDNPPYFVNSNIAAENITSAYIAYPQHFNSGTPFGITMFNGYNLKKLTIKDEYETHSWKGIDIGEAIDMLTNQGSDMQIRRD